ncbi:hypothetical protein AHAS_Ahas17G0159900 [Arachis hypogaea]
MGAPGRIHKVLFDPDDKKIQCDCSMWNSEGIPCSHIFCVMKHEGLDQIPDSLIMRRWCKNAKDSSRMPVTTRPGHEGRMLRYATLCSATSLVARLGSEEGEDFEFARESIASVIEKLRHRFYERAGGQPGHTKKTCSGGCARGVSELGNGVSPTFGKVDCILNKILYMPTCLHDQTSTHSDGGLNNVSSSAVNTSSMVNRRGSPSWRPPFCGGEVGGPSSLGANTSTNSMHPNLALGTKANRRRTKAIAVWRLQQGQRMRTFLNGGCSRHAGSPEMYYDVFYFSVLAILTCRLSHVPVGVEQNVIGPCSSSKMPGGAPTRGT